MGDLDGGGGGGGTEGVDDLAATPGFSAGKYCLGGGVGCLIMGGGLRITRSEYIELAGDSTF